MRVMFAALAALLAAAVQTQALSVEYYAVIQENGDAVVVANILGNGTFTAQLPADVTEVKVRGALYVMDNRTVELSVGSSGEAAMLYRTSVLTEKEGSRWLFAMEPAGAEKLTVAMPNNTVVSWTEPMALMNSSSVLMLIWDAPAKVSMEYAFGMQNSAGGLDETDGKGSGDFGMTLLMPAGIAVFVALAGLAALRARKMKRETTEKNRENIMRTLSNNHRLVVSLLLQSGGAMKRSHLERKSGLAKSSLALVLRDLERKKIVEVDRSFPSHHIKFTEWFNGL